MLFHIEFSYFILKNLIEIIKKKAINKNIGIMIFYKAVNGLKTTAEEQIKQKKIINLD